MARVRVLIAAFLFVLGGLSLSSAAYAAGASISASPNPTTTGSTVVTWTTGDGSTGQVYVSMNGGQSVLFDQGTGDSITAPWIQPGNTYTFVLYGGTSQATVLGQVVVQGASPPTITATPNPVPTNNGSGTTTLNWNTGDGSYGQVYVSVNGGVETVVGQGASGQITISWIQQGSTYVFRLYQGTAHQNVLAQVTVTTPPPAVSASPNPTSNGVTNVTWATNNGSQGQVYVSMNGGPESLFAQGTGGTNTATWIQAGSTYVFTLYAGTSHSTQLAQTSVTGTQPPTLTASPNPTPNGSTTITWYTGTGTTGQVYFSVNGGPDTLFAQGPSGSATANWIQAGNTYQFKLYSGTNHSTLLTQITVTPATSISATPPSGGSSTITWNTGDGSTGQVYVSVNGKSDVLFASGSGGSATAAWIQPGNTYVFRLYQGTAHAVVLAQTTVNG